MKTKKILIILIVFLICVIPINSFAITEVDEVISDGDDFLGRAKDTSSVIDLGKLQNLSGDIYNIIFATGLVIDVIVGLVIGIKFIISSVEERAKIKEILTIYVIGSIVLFGAFTIWKITMGILGNA